MVNGCEITKKQGAYVTKNEPLKSHGLRGCLYNKIAIKLINIPLKDTNI